MRGCGGGGGVPLMGILIQRLNLKSFGAVLNIRET
jgi:hypothetical protein